MATQRLTIGGRDFTSCLAAGGLKWSRNDVDASGSGRDKRGRMRRKRVTSKVKLQVTCRALKHSEMVALNAALWPETVSVGYLDPRRGQVTSTFYGSEVSSATAMTFGGETIWEGATFSLVEV